MDKLEDCPWAREVRMVARVFEDAPEHAAHAHQLLKMNLSLTNLHPSLLLPLPKWVKFQTHHTNWMGIRASDLTCGTAAGCAARTQARAPVPFLKQTSPKKDSLAGGVGKSIKLRLILERSTFTLFSLAPAPAIAASGLRRAKQPSTFNLQSERDLSGRRSDGRTQLAAPAASRKRPHCNDYRSGFAEILFPRYGCPSGAASQANLRMN